MKQNFEEKHFFSNGSCKNLNTSFRSAADVEEIDLVFFSWH